MATKTDALAALAAAYPEEEEVLSRRDAALAALYPDGKPSKPEPTIQDWQPDIDENPFMSALIGMGSGMNRAYQGVEQVYNGLAPWVSDAAVERRNKEVSQERALFDNTPVGQSLSGQAGQFVGEALPTVIVPGGLTGGLVRRAATGAISGAGTGALQFVDEGGSRASNMAIGGALGGIMPGVVDGAVGGIRALGRAMPAGGPEQAAARLAARNPLIQQGAEFDVPIYAPDVGGTTSKNLENISNASLGGGMDKARQVQMGAAYKAAEQQQQQFHDAMMQHTPSGAGSIRQTAEDLDSPYQISAQQLLKQVDSMDGADEWTFIMRNGGSAEVMERKIEAGKNYNIVEQLAGETPVPLKHATKVLKQVRGELENEWLPESGAATILAKLDEKVQGGGTFQDVRRARSNLNDSIRDTNRGATNAMVGTKGATYLTRVEQALERDLDAFAEGKPGLSQAYNHAQNFYNTQVVPYKDGWLGKALSHNNASPEEIFGNFRKMKDKPQRMQRFYEALDERGKQAIRYGYLSEAMEVATRGGDTFSPSRYRDHIRNTWKVRDTLFDDESAKQIAGLENVMSAVADAVGASANVATGKQTMPLGVLVGGAMAGSDAGAGAAAGAVGSMALGSLLRGLLTNPAYTQLVSEAASKKNLPYIMARVPKLMQQLGVIGAIDTANQPNEDSNSQ